MVVYRGKEGIMAVDSSGITRSISFDELRYGKWAYEFSNIKFRAVYSGDKLFKVDWYGHIDEAEIRFTRANKIKNTIERMELLGNDKITLDDNGDIIVLDKGLRRVRIPDVCRRIPNRAFQYSNVADVVIGKGVYEIDDFAFNGCGNIKSIEIHSNVRRLGFGCFMGCSRLQMIILNEGLEKIGKSAFSFCGSLTYLKLPRTLKGSIDLYNIFYSLDTNITIDVPLELKNRVIYKKDRTRGNDVKYMNVEYY